MLDSFIVACMWDLRVTSCTLSLREQATRAPSNAASADAVPILRLMKATKLMAVLGLQYAIHCDGVNAISGLNTYDETLTLCRLRNQLKEARGSCGGHSYGMQKTRCQEHGNGGKPARVAQSVERKALNLVVVGSSPTSSASVFFSSRIECRVSTGRL